MINTGAELLKRTENALEQQKSLKSAVRVCMGTGCLSAGAEVIFQGFKELIGDSVEEIASCSGCHGLCELGPLVRIDPEGILYTSVTAQDVPEIVESTLKQGKPVQRLLYKNPATGETAEHEEQIPFYARQKRVALRNCGIIDPESLDQFVAHDGLKGLSKALLEMTPDQVIEEIKKAKLRGRGGAGFTTGMKWEICRNQPGDTKYMICNGDEGDPGAFMDRSVMEGDPFSVLEGMTIAGYALGANHGFIYVRHEYPLAVKRLEKAIAILRSEGLLGENILGSGFDFQIDIVRGAGAFVCGEETALIQSIEGLRGSPQVRPPYPAQSGLWGKPTNVNNVETLTNVPAIMNHGADWYLSIGTPDSGGTKVFALTGDIAHTGLVEVPLGMTLRELIFDVGGGIRNGKKFKAVQIGGPSGGCIPETLLDTVIDFSTLQSHGAMMGSGGMVIVNNDTCMVDLARYFLDFARKESCGKCVPCRIGTHKLHEILEKFTQGKGTREELDQLKELATVTKSSSLCGLGQTAPNPVLTTLRYFAEEYEAHLEGKCPAGKCTLQAVSGSVV